MRFSGQTFPFCYFPFDRQTTNKLTVPKSQGRLEVGSAWRFMSEQMRDVALREVKISPPTKFIPGLHWDAGEGDGSGGCGGIHICTQPSKHRSHSPAAPLCSTVTPWVICWQTDSIRAHLHTGQLSHH